MSDEKSQSEGIELASTLLEALDLPGAPSGWVCPACGGALWE